MYTLGIFHLFHGPLLVLAPFAFPELHLAYVNYFYFLIFLYTLTDRKCPITLLAKYHHCRQYGEPAPKYPEMAIFGWSESMSDIFFMTTTVGYIGSLLYVVLPMDDFRVSGIISCLYLHLFTFTTPIIFDISAFRQNYQYIKAIYRRKVTVT